MTGQQRLIIRAERMSAFSLSPQRARDPHVAIVYATRDGEVEVLEDGRPLRGRMFAPYRTRYEVDLRRFARVVDLAHHPLPCRRDVYRFEGSVSVAFRVTDPAEVVRRYIRDAWPAVWGHVWKRMRDITRSFAIEDAEQAEEAVNRSLRGEIRLVGGVSVCGVTARLTLDAAAREYLQRQESARRDNMVKAAAHETNLDEASRLNQLHMLQQAAEHATRERERNALAGRELTAEELVLMHLERNPADTAGAMELINRYHRERMDQWEKNLVRAQAFIERVGTEHLQRPDIADLVKKTLGDLASGPAIGAPPGGSSREFKPQPIESPPTWDAPVSTQMPTPDPMPSQGAVVPVYVVIDESAHTEPVLAGIDRAVNLLCATLIVQPAAAGVIRLSVVGFADDVVVRLSMEKVHAATRVPSPMTRGEAHYSIPFQWLLRQIPRDIARLQSQRQAVGRPQVVFLTAGPPVADDRWELPYKQLISSDNRPDIVACGIDATLGETVAAIATKPQLAFVAAPGADPGAAMTNVTPFLQDLVVRYGQAFLTGSQGPVITAPEGFIGARRWTDPEDGWDKRHA